VHTEINMYKYKSAFVLLLTYISLSISIPAIPGSSTFMVGGGSARRRVVNGPIATDVTLGKVKGTTNDTIVHMFSEFLVGTVCVERISACCLIAHVLVDS